MQTCRIIAIGFALCFAFGGSLQADDVRLAKRGEQILVANCARCHAIGRTAASPLAQAPPFRDLPHKYNIEHLAEALAEGITTGHPDMPAFIFEPPEIDAILAYLKSPMPEGDSTQQPPK